MYTLSTQLTCFKFNQDSKGLIVNIKWFKLDNSSDRDLIPTCFNELEINQLYEFTDKNKLNFPGSCFIEDAKNERYDKLHGKELSETWLPLHLILSNNSCLRPDNYIYKVMMITLTDENYNTTIQWDLDFDIIGKIEIYKQAKTVII